MDAVKRGLIKFLSLVPANATAIITVPLIKNLRHSTLENLLVTVGLGALTKGDRRMSLDNGASLHLAPLNANTLRGADIILAIWPTHHELPQLEATNRWQSLVVVGYDAGDWQAWEAMHAPLVLL